MTASTAPTSSSSSSGSQASGSTSYMVTASGTNVAISPSVPQNVRAGSTQTLTIVSNSGYSLSTTVGGTCPAGTWNGSTYITGTINANCSVTFSASASLVNGACGISNGMATSSAPSVNLCAAGTASTVTSSAQFIWTCTGINGGGVAQCSAPISSSSSGSSTYQDGSSGAPVGSPKYPNILSGYAKRPGWKVAGVDYHVGVPSGTVLKDPTVQANLPAGATYSATAHSVTVVSSGVTLDSFDFSLHNATQLVLNAGNVTVRNSYFAVASNLGANGAMVVANGSASNISFYNNEFNGMDVAVTAQAGQSLNINSSGTALFEYNYFHDSGGDMIDFSGGPQTDIVQYNLFANIGVNTAHSDTLQWYNAKEINSVIAFNTVYQAANQPGAGMGALNVYDEGPTASMSKTSVNNNTVIQLASCTTCNWTLGTSLDLGAVGDHMSIRDNFIDPSGALGYTGMWFFATGSASWAFPTFTVIANTTNMVSGTNYTSFPKAYSFVAAPDVNGYTPSMNDVYNLTASPATGTLTSGQSVSVTLNMDAAYTVTGSPSLSLNNGAVATYSSGSGTNALTFKYTVGSQTAVSALAVTGVNLNGATVIDNVGNSANLTNVTTTFTGLQVGG